MTDKRKAIMEATIARYHKNTQHETDKHKDTKAVVQQNLDEAELEGKGDRHDRK